jgi:hypothetical protein
LTFSTPPPEKWSGKLLSTANNPWGASWTYGGSDRSLPTDMGMIIGEYIAAITTAK